MREYMGILIAIFLLGLLCTLSFFRGHLFRGPLFRIHLHEGFNSDDRPLDFPDHSYSADLILAEKHLEQMLKSPSSKTPYLEDLLMLLQRI